MRTLRLREERCQGYIANECIKLLGSELKLITLTTCIIPSVYLFYQLGRSSKAGTTPYLFLCQGLAGAHNQHLVNVKSTNLGHLLSKYLSACYVPGTTVLGQGEQDGPKT